MLHPVAQLRQHAVGNVQRVLGDKKHAHALAAHQAHHQFNALNQCLGRVFEQQVRLVKKEHQLGLVQVAHLGQGLKQFAQHPQQKGGVQARRVHELVCGQDVDHAFAATAAFAAKAGVGLHEIGNIEHGLAKKAVAALGRDLQQAALDGAYAGSAHIAVFGGVGGRVVAHVLAHGAQVLQIEQQQTIVVGNFEHQLQHAGLGFIEVEHAREQQRPQITHRGAHRVALGAQHVPQRGGKGGKRRGGQAARGQHFGQLVAQRARLRDAAQVALDIGHKHRHAQIRKTFGQGLQGDGFARAGGAGDQAMAVSPVGPQKTGVCALGVRVLADKNAAVLNARHESPKKYNGTQRLTNIQRISRGRTQQMGQYSAPQGPPGREARQDLDAHHP